MPNITDKTIVVIPVTQDINDTEVDNLEREQSEQENNQQSDKEAEEQDDGVVTVNDHEVTSMQHSRKDGGDEEYENPEDIEDKQDKEQDYGVVTVNDDEVSSMQHSSKDGGDGECENPEDIEDKTETLIIDKEKESVKQNENQAFSKDNIEKYAEDDTRSVDDSQDCNDETNRILFGDTLLKHLKKLKVKGDKEQFKWTGDLQQLKDFTTLILNVRGTWKKAGIKHTFHEAQGKLIINWWQTNKTLHIQGSQDIVDEYEERLSELISKGKSKSDSPEEITDTTKNDASNVKKANKKKGKKNLVEMKKY